MFFMDADNTGKRRIDRWSNSIIPTLITHATRTCRKKSSLHCLRERHFCEISCHIVNKRKKEKTNLTITRSSRKVKDGRNFLIGLRCGHKFMWMKGTDSETHIEYVPVCFRVITVLLPVGWRHTNVIFLHLYNTGRLRLREARGFIAGIHENAWC